MTDDPYTIRAMTKIVALLVIASTAAFSQRTVPITAEPHHHLVLKNRYTRVFQVNVPPKQSTLMHTHKHDYLYVTLGTADIENHVDGKPPVEQKLADGQTNLFKGPFAHEVRDLADTPFRNVTIEILRRGGPPKEESERGVSVGQGFMVDTIFDTDAVRVSDTKLMPDAMLPKHTHRYPHLLVAVSDMELRSEVPGKSAIPIHAKAGDVNWIKPGLTHMLLNVGKQPARFITVEFK